MSRISARMFNSFSCLSNDLHDTPSYSDSSTSVPIIGLINGLSGGHKGEKVQRILTRAKIPVFDLLMLSTNDDYFNSFIQQFVQIYDNIIMEELHRIKNKTDDNFYSNPRILIGGGDGSIAWALSLLDRALLSPELLRIFWRRARIISNISDIKIDDIIEPDIKQKLSFNTTISDHFYYSHSDHFVTSQHTTRDDENSTDSSTNIACTITPVPIHESTSTCLNTVSIDVTNDNNTIIQTQISHPIIETNAIISENQETLRAPKIPETDIDLENEQKIDNEIEYVSSASLSAQDEAKIIESFMNQKLSINSSPNKHERLFKKRKIKEMNGEEINLDDDTEIDINNMNNDSLSESLVTKEELISVMREKESAAFGNNKKTLDDLRILQGVYDSRIGPAIALIPLGTGNDLSRCLGTGFAYPGSKELIQNLLKEYKQSPLTKLDRWKIQFFETDNEIIKNRQTSEMLCYFSVGFEGEIAYKFDKARSTNPKLFDRPWKNKIQYTLSGIGAGIQEAFGITKPLNDVIECYVDDKKLKLPSNTRSLVISNIQSMADGVFFWGKGTDTKKDMKNSSEPMFGDGKLEVMTAKGIYKYLQMRVGMSHYRRLAQPKKVKIIMKTELPIQIDGESWIESEGVVEIYLLHQVFAIVGKNEPRGIQII